MIVKYLLIVDLTSKLDCDLNMNMMKAWLIIKSVLHQLIFPEVLCFKYLHKRPKDPGICIQINAIQLHLIIFPKSMSGMIY